MRYGKHKESKKITHEEVKEAIERFERDGGLITKLPDQVKTPSNLVGVKYGSYESPSGFQEYST